jgi:hypothetical protein
MFAPWLEHEYLLPRMLANSGPALPLSRDTAKVFSNGFYLYDRPEGVADFSAQDPPEVRTRVLRPWPLIFWASQFKTGSVAVLGFASAPHVL